MTEPVKTLGIAAVALGLVIWAAVVSWKPNEQLAQEQKWLVDINNAQSKVASLKIVTFDAKTGQAQPFEVTKTKTGYTIPSHENYPADASKHLGEAAASVSKIESISVAGETQGTHEEFGVVDPEGSGAKLGATDVGTRVTLKDTKGNVLADFIIGKEVANAQGLRYLRLADKDQVYVVKLDTQYLSTKFEDWIEKDLLQIDPLNLREVGLADYSVITEPQLVQLGGKIQQISLPVDLNERSTMELKYDAKDLKWQIDKWVVFKDRKPKPEKLAEDQEVNQKKLDDLKSALDDLKIADVRRKPPGLEGNVEQFLQNNREAMESLMKKGFYPMAPPHPETGKPVFQVLSDQGDVIARMENGVEYILRFGGVAGGQAADAAAKPAAEKKNQGDPEGKSESKSTSKLLRYLWVMTRFNEKMIPKPELEKVPDLAAADAAEPDAKEPAPGAKPEDAKKEESKDGAKKNEATPEKPKATNTQAPQPDEAKGDGAKKDAAPKDEAPPAAIKKEEAKKAEEKSGAADNVPEGKKEGPKEEAQAGEKEQKKEPAKPHPEALKKRREEIIKENKARQKDYEKKLAEGKAEVEKLNKRFADWYYIISDETYQKIHLGQKDVVQKKPPKEEKKEEGAAAPAGVPEDFDPGKLIPGLPGK
jgi:hypothetical protein